MLVVFTHGCLDFVLLLVVVMLSFVNISQVIG